MVLMAYGILVGVFLGIGQDKEISEWSYFWRILVVLMFLPLMYLLELCFVGVVFSKI